MEKKRNLEAWSSSRIKFNQQQLLAIQGLVDLHRENAIKLASVKSNLIRNILNSKIYWLSTIGRYMRIQQKLSNKTREKKNPTSTKPENWRKFSESAWIQSTLKIKESNKFILISSALKQGISNIKDWV